MSAVSVRVCQTQCYGNNRLKSVKPAQSATVIESRRSGLGPHSNGKSAGKIPFGSFHSSVVFGFADETVMVLWLFFWCQLC